jgi:hypothetical protein
MTKNTKTDSSEINPENVQAVTMDQLKYTDKA